MKAPPPQSLRDTHSNAHGSWRRGVLLGQFGIDDDRHRDDEVRHRELVELIEGGLEGVVVDDRELLGLHERACRHLHRGKTTGCDGPIERPLDVLGRDRGAVVEGGVLAQMEDVGLAVVGRLPAFGEFRRHDLGVIGDRAVGKRLFAMTDEPVVGLPDHHAAVIVGGRHHGVEAVGAHFGNDDQRILRNFGRQAWCAGQCDGRREQRRRKGCSIELHIVHPP